MNKQIINLSIIEVNKLIQYYFKNYEIALKIFGNSLTLKGVFEKGYEDNYIKKESNYDSIGFEFSEEALKLINEELFRYITDGYLVFNLSSEKAPFQTLRPTEKGVKFFNKN